MLSLPRRYYSLHDHDLRASGETIVSVLGKLVSAGLKLKPEKCRLMQKSVSFLGRVVSGDEIATDPAKTKMVSEGRCLRRSRTSVHFLA